MKNLVTRTRGKIGYSPKAKILHLAVASRASAILRCKCEPAHLRSKCLVRSWSFAPSKTKTSPQGRGGSRVFAKGEDFAPCCRFASERHSAVQMRTSALAKQVPCSKLELRSVKNKNLATRTREAGYSRCEDTHAWRLQASLTRFRGVCEPAHLQSKCLARSWSFAPSKTKTSSQGRGFCFWWGKLDSDQRSQ